MRLTRATATIVLASLAFSAPGCLFGQLLSRTADSWGSAPRPAPSRVTHPFRRDARLAVLWVGHATALIQLDDKLVLTDPVLTNTVGQLSPRLVEPGIAPERMPPLDAVLISHLHFDHLSLGSLELIESKVRWLGLPEGGLTYLTDFSFPAREVPPWTTWESGGLRVTAVPVQHGGWRYGLDKAWMPHGATGWVVEYHGITVYFGGDTGYDKRCFLATRARFPSIDLALLPIAPIAPRDFMRSRHLEPAGALDAYHDLCARWLVPVHFDTFVNSLDDPGAAPRLLQAELQRRKWPPDRVALLAVGEQKVFIPVPGAETRPLPQTGCGTP